LQDAVFQAGVPRPGLARELQQSYLIGYFNRVLWLLVQSLDFFLFDRGNNILKTVVLKIFQAG
jgi:hypothetical protein